MEYGLLQYNMTTTKAQLQLAQTCFHDMQNTFYEMLHCNTLTTRAQLQLAQTVFHNMQWEDSMH